MSKTLKITLISGGALLLALIIILSAVLLSVMYPAALVSGEGDLRIICVGDSITYGQGVIGSRPVSAYTAYLAEMIPDSTVVNYGLCNRTLLSSGNMPYTEETLFDASHSEKADVVIIMLGSNDSKPMFWDKEKYAAEYREFIKSYISMSSSPDVYIMIPPRVYAEQDTGNCNDATIGGELADTVRALGAELGVEVIDLYTLTTDHPEWFTDGLHPNADGNFAIAEEISRIIKQ